MVATVGANFRSSGLDARGGVVIGRAGQADAHAVEVEDRAVLEAGERRAVGDRADWRRTAETCASPMRWKNVALPKSNSWLPGTKMSGGIRLVSVMMWAPRSNPDISEGDKVSPAWANDDVAAFGALGLDDGGEPGKPAAALAVGCQVCAHLIDIVDQDERDRRPRRSGHGSRPPGEASEARQEGCDEAAAEWHAFESLREIGRRGLPGFDGS